jgi:hypothetical protein
MKRGFEVDLLRDQGRRFPPGPLDLHAQSMRIWHCKYSTLDAVSQFRHLRTLSVAGFPDASLDAIGSLDDLEWLSILHLPKVTSLAPLGRLSQLRCLSLSTTPGWDGSNKRTTVDSLQPIAELPALENLELFGVVPTDRSLAALEHASRLRSVRVSKYLMKEEARFRAVTNLSNAFMPPPNFESWRRVGLTSG